MKSIQPGDSITVLENESKQRFDILVTEVHRDRVVGPFSTNGRTFDEGSFSFDEYIFPGDKNEAVDLLCELVKFHQRNVDHDLAPDDQMLLSRAAKLAAKFEPEIVQEPVAV